MGDVERLDAKTITRKEQPPFLAVPDRKGPHSIESPMTLDAPFTKRAEHNFRIGMGSKMMTARLQIGTNFFEVVDLAVEDDHQIAAGIAERLVSRGRKIDERQTRARQRDVRFDVHRAPIGPRCATESIMRHAVAASGVRASRMKMPAIPHMRSSQS